MDLYEYQGKELFARFGIPVSEGRLATTPEEARTAAEELGGQVVVKAQVLTGRAREGRRNQARRHARGGARRARREILGMDIRGHVVRQGSGSSGPRTSPKEYYLSITFDRGEKKPLFMLTTAGRRRHRGGRRAARPRRSRRLHVDPLVGFQPYQARWLCFTAGVDDPDEQKQVIGPRRAALRRVRRPDAMLCEVNPLIVTPRAR